MYRVVLVDDEPGVVDGLAVMIDWKSLGFEIVGTAADGAEALEIVRETHPDVVITDIRMPEVDGIELIRRAQSVLDIPTRFVIVSGHREFEYARTAITLGVEDYLLKPIYEEELSRTLESLLEKLKKADQESDEILERVLSEGSTDDEFLNFCESPYYGILAQIDDYSLSAGENPTGSSTAMDRLHRYATRILKIEANAGYVERMNGAGFAFLSAAAIRRNHGTIRRYLDRLASYVSRGDGITVSFVCTNESQGVVAAREFWGSRRRMRELLRIEGPETVCEATSLLNSGPVDDAGGFDPDPNLMHTIADGDTSAVEDALSKSRRAALSLPLEPTLATDYARKICFEIHRLVTDLSGNPSNIDALTRLCAADLRDACIATIFNLIIDAAIDTTGHLSSLSRLRPSARMQRVREDLMQSFTDDVTIRDLAERHGISAAYLGQLFRREFGESFKDYRNRLRVEEAARYLRTTDLRVYEIAQRVGYQSTDYFERRFQSFYGVTPTAYRSGSAEDGSPTE